MLDFLFATSNASITQSVTNFCESEKQTYQVEGDFNKLLSLIEKEKIKFIFIDIDDEFLKGLQLMEWIQTRYIYAQIGVVAKKTYTNKYMQALRLGATALLSYKECQDINWLKRRLNDLLHNYEKQNALTYYTSSIENKPSIAWVGLDARIRFLLEEVRVLASVNQQVLISGEKGTGKKSLAYILAAQKPYRATVLLDAEKTPDYEQKVVLKKNIEQSLRQKNNKDPFELCLIISEISSLHLELQEMIIEYLKEGLYALFDDETKFAIQLLVTSSKNLAKEVSDGFLREDMYLILKNCQLIVPPLRERVTDIPLLIEFFLNMTEDIDDDQRYFSRDAMNSLMQYDWPKNVSELKEVVAAIKAKEVQGTISARMLPHKILQKSFYTSQNSENVLSDMSYNDAKKHVLANFNQTYITELLERCDQNVTVAAEKAGMDRSNFKKIIKKYTIK